MNHKNKYTADLETREITNSLWERLDTIVNNKDFDNKSVYSTECLNLYRQILLYRVYPNLFDLLRDFPQNLMDVHVWLENWKYFDRHTQEELSDCAIHFLKEALS